MSDDVITVERLERALVLCAYLVELDGPIMIPMFQRLERDLAVLRAQQDTVARAKRLLESYGGFTARLSLAPPAT
jgi:hypothetical protein